MRKKMSGMVAMAVLTGLTSCASEPYVLEGVGPAPVSHAHYRPVGYLRVYSATETHEIGENTYYYPHTGYKILGKAGKLWKYVPNHTANEDESPTWVAVPVGNYIVKAQSDLYAVVDVPVVIQEDQITVLHLDSGWRPPGNVSHDEIVYLPNGVAVGWRSGPGD